MCLGVEIKNMNRTKMPYLVFSLLIDVFVEYFGHFSAIPVGCRFAVFSLSTCIYTPSSTTEKR